MSAMAETDAERITEHEPMPLINSVLPQNATLKSRVAIAAAIRNPDASAGQLGEFVGISATTVANATASFYRGMLEERGKMAETGTGAELPDDNHLTMRDLTPKKRAIIEFAARYPKVPKEVDDWTWGDVVNYLTETYGTEMTTTYPTQVVKQHAEFIEQYREQLKENDEFPAEDAPEKPEEVPESIRDRLEPHVILPDANLDDLANPTETWVEPYWRANLDTVKESKLPHRKEHLSGGADSGGETVQKRRGNAKYSGPSTGIDARTERVTHLSQIAKKHTDDKPSTTVNVDLPRPLVNRLQKQVDAGEFDDLGDALVAHAISKAGVTEDGEIPEFTRSEVEDREQDAANEAVQEFATELSKRYGGFKSVIQSEYDKHVSEHTAARLTVIEHVCETLDDLANSYQGDRDD